MREESKEVIKNLFLHQSTLTRGIRDINLK